jgi:hypothetical protein
MTVKEHDYVSMKISKRAVDLSIACYCNLKDKGLEDPANMMFLIAMIAGIARANNTDIVLDENFMQETKKLLEKRG